MEEQPLSRGEICGILGILLGVLVGVWPMNWLHKLLFLVVATILVIYAVNRLRWTIGLSRIYKVIFSLVAFIAMVGISYYPIKEQWERDHPTKPTARTETPSTTAPPIPIIKKEPPQKPPSQTNNISPKPTIQKEQPIKPKTLQDLFKQDFPSVMKVSQEITFNFNDGTILKIYMNEYADFEGKTKYLGFYIPMSSKSYTICEAILDEYKKLMADIESKSEVTGGHVADSAQTSLHDLIFSGRIFIYHEDNFSLQQLAALERLYQSKGLSVVFRGHAHLLTSWSFRKP